MSQSELNLTENFKVLGATSKNQPATASTQSSTAPGKRENEDTAPPKKNQLKRKRKQDLDPMKEMSAQNYADHEDDTLGAINKAGMCSSAVVKQITDLRKNFDYHVCEIRSFDHLPWSCVMVEIQEELDDDDDDDEENEPFCIFLPRRMAEKITPKFMEDVNLRKNYFIEYMGQLDTGKRNAANLLQFKKK